MNHVAAFDSYPWVRAVVPLAVGIGTAGAVPDSAVGCVPSGYFPVCFFVCLCALCVCMGYCYFRLHACSSLRWFGFFLTLFWLVLGAGLTVLSRDGHSFLWPDEPVAVRAVVTDVPQDNGRTVACGMEVLSAVGKDGECGADGRRIQVYMQPSAEALSLRPGDGLWFVAVVCSPANRGNPDEFDYVAWLRRRNVTGVVGWLASGRWRAEALTQVERQRLSGWFRLRVRALGWREELVELYRKAGLQGEELAVVSALTLGDKRELTKELRDVYSMAGASHLLALSGLHLGILLSLFNLFFLRRLRYNRWYFPGVAGAFLFIWGYTFLAGLPASLVRAASMYSLLLAATALGRRTLSLNLLSLAVFLMLLVNPAYLFDVGFQLSCAAMAALLTLAPRLSGLYQARHRWLRPVWHTFAAGVAAQAGTAPLIAFYFHLFTPWAPVAGLAALPLTTFLVAASPLLWVCGRLCPQWELPVRIITGTVGLQNGWLDWAASWPAARWENLYPSPGMVAALYLLLLSLLYRPAGSRLRKFITCGLFVALVAALGMYDRWRERESPCLWFYNLPACPVAHAVCSPSCSYLFTPYPDSVFHHTRHIADTYWRRRLTRPPRVVDLNKGEAPAARVQDGWVCLPGKTVLLLFDDRWTHRRSVPPQEPDCMYVTRGYRGRLAGLKDVFRPGMVILDASLGRRRAERYAAECDSLGWPCHDLRTQGALKVAFR